MNYWFLKKWDNSEIRVKPTPENLSSIKAKLSKGEGHIVTRTGSISVKDIKEFYESDTPVPQETNLVDSGLTEEAARAFREPLVNPDQSIATRYVKKRVTRRKWDSYYSPHPDYHLLEEEDAHVIMGFRIPSHLVDGNSVQYCTPDEVKQLAH